MLRTQATARSERTRLRIGDHHTDSGRDVATPSPGFERLAARQCIELAQPDAAQQRDADIGAAEIFVSAIGDHALTELRDIVLDADDIGMIFQLLDMDLAATDGGAEFGDGAVLFGALRLPCAIALGRLACE